MHGGVATNQYQLYRTAAGSIISYFYPYQFQFGDQVNTAGGNAAATNAYAIVAAQPYGLHYPHHAFPYWHCGCKTFGHFRAVNQDMYGCTSNVELFSWFYREVHLRCLARREFGNVGGNWD